MLNVVFASKNPGKLREIEVFFQEHRLLAAVVMPPDLPDVEETGQTFLENARLKANACYQALKSSGRSLQSLPVLAEDSGFEVPALAGCYGLDPFPGVCSNRWMTPEVRRVLLGIDTDFEALPLTPAHLNAGILRLLEQRSPSDSATGQDPGQNPGQNRRVACRYVSTLVLLDESGQEVFQGEGVLDLTLVSDRLPRGTEGFGYDPIVCPIPRELAGTDLSEGLTLAQMTPSDKNRISHRGKALTQLCHYLVSLSNSSRSS